jgi:hypothetical protein
VLQRFSLVSAAEVLVQLALQGFRLESDMCATRAWVCVFVCACVREF